MKLHHHNLFQAMVMLMSMSAMLGVVGYILAGRDGLVLVGVMVAFFLLFGRGASKDLMLRALHAVRLEPRDAPILSAILAELAGRAELVRVPDVYVLDSEVMLGFSTGGGEDDAAVVLTAPLIQALNAREIAAVLAHEVSHIAAGDLLVMGMADTITRMTRTLSMVGLILILLNVPLAMAGKGAIPWGGLLLLVAAPMVNFLLQMALSRAREFVADADAVDISGDPAGLVSALEKLEIHQRGLFRHIFLPHEPGAEPSLLRSHPVTEERIRRILTHSPAMEPLPPSLVGEQHGYPGAWPAPLGLPFRWLIRWWR
ncbi:MAG: M48 family metalloprotease [Alphaproteobacteria bacterium]|nr:M48 family metalloprotease [Alphaproteobacteria bacterium]